MSNEREHPQVTVGMLADALGALSRHIAEEVAPACRRYVDEVGAAFVQAGRVYGEWAEEVATRLFPPRDTGK